MYKYLSALTYFLIPNPKYVEGRMPFTVPGIEKPCYTYYKIFGDISARERKPAIIVLHGGPGAGHEYLLALAELVDKYSFPVVFYDQIGTGQSTHLRETAGYEKLWQEPLFIRELDTLIDHLQLRECGYHLFGQSWGGMLGASYAATHPRGLNRLVLANAPASMELFMKSVRKLIEQLPEHLQQIIDKAEEDGKYDTPEYQAAIEVFYKKHLCIVEPWPAPEVAVALQRLTEDPTVYGTMMGPSEVTVTGTLKTWTVIDRLKSIDAPTLLYNGEFDEVQDLCVAPFFEHIPKVKWSTIQAASHFTHVEQKEKVLKLVGEFLKGA